MNCPRALLAAVVTAAGLTPALSAATPVEEAAAAIRDGQYIQAEDLLVPLVNSGHPDAVALSELAIVRVAQKRYEDAVPLAERATKADPNNVDYLVLLGHACEMRLGELGPMDATAMSGKMRKAFEKALKLDPHNLTAMLGLLRFFEHAPEVAGGDTKKAWEFAGRVREIDPHQGELELSRLAADAKNYNEAITHLEAALKLKPDDLNTATSLAWTLFNLGRKAEARARFEAVIKVDPNNALARQGIERTATPAH